MHAAMQCDFLRSMRLVSGSAEFCPGRQYLRKLWVKIKRKNVIVSARISRHAEDEEEETD